MISAGPLLGKTYALRLGNQLLGRSDDADILVSSSDLSRRHAYLSWDGTGASIADAGSTNGTIINGERIGGARPLRVGDIVRLGSLELRFDVPGLEATSELPAVGARQEWRNAIRGVNYGDINQAARDVNISRSEYHRHGEEDPWDELFQGRGPGRIVMALGLVIALSGFAAWMYLIFSGGTSINDPNAGSPFEREAFGLPVAMLAFGAFGLGGVIAAIGGGMSRAARARERSRDNFRHARSSPYG